MVALAVRVRTSSGFSRTSLMKPLASRVTFRVSLSDSLRSSPTSSPSRCMKRSNSPGFSRSTWLRSSGRLRKRREVAEIEFEAAKQPIHRVVAADDHFDGGETEAGLVWRRRIGSPERPAPRLQGLAASGGDLAIARQHHERGDDGDQPDLEQACGAGREPRNGGLDEDRHDLYNVTHGSIKGQSTRTQNVIALSNPPDPLITTR